MITVFAYKIYRLRRILNHGDVLPYNFTRAYSYSHDPPFVGKLVNTVNRVFHNAVSVKIDVRESSALIEKLV